MKSEFETLYDSITKIKCPHQIYVECWNLMIREELKVHMKMHPGEHQEPEYYWQLEAEYKYEQGPRDKFRFVRRSYLK